MSDVTKPKKPVGPTVYLQMLEMHVYWSFGWLGMTVANSNDGIARRSQFEVCRFGGIYRRLRRKWRGWLSSRLE